MTKKLENFIDGEYRDILDEIKERYRHAKLAWDPMYAEALEDLHFLQPGGMWDENMKAQREEDGRPCLEVDRLSPFIHQIVNDFRQSRPQPQINPVGNGADKDTAEVFQGMIRHIIYNGNGEIATDTAYESMVRCGIGYFRLLTEYEEDGFDQEVTLKRIPNPFMVLLDPSFQEPDGSDAAYGFICSWVSQKAYSEQFPASKMTTYDRGTWDTIGNEEPEWVQNDHGALVVEYFRKVPKPIKLYKLADGSTTDQKPDDESVVVGERDATRMEIHWFKVNAVEVLEQTIFPGRYVPILPMFGSELNVDGKRMWSGITRRAKDPARAFNYWKSAQAETIALAPKAPWVGALGFMGANRAAWKEANRRNIPVLEYEPISQNGEALPPPQRQAFEPPTVAITNAMAGAVDDLKATTGMYDASLGNREADQSGVAIRQLQRQGQSSNFHYQDNAARTIRHLGRILLDVIPAVYDTQRVVRILNPDQSSDQVTVNAPYIDTKTGAQKMHQLGVGKYDVSVSVGPSYQTKRQENLALLESMLGSPLGKVLATAAPDLIVSMMDFDIAPELQDRMKKLLPPELQNQQGQPQIPPQVQAQMGQMQGMIQKLTEALNQANSEVAAKKMELDAKERIAILQAQAGILEAALKTGSQESIALLGHQMDFLKARFAQDDDQGGMNATPQQQPTPQQMGQPQQVLDMPMGGGNGALAPAAMPGQPGGAPVLS